MSLPVSESNVAVIIISADTEWKIIKKILPSSTEYNPSPFGEWCRYQLPEKRDDPTVAILLHGGWGKIDAAASAQYAIDRWRPDRIINIGTAGGFPDKSHQGKIYLVEKAVTYDIHEKMGDSDEAIKYYSSEVPIPEGLEEKNFPLITIASGDQDLSPEKIPHLVDRFDATAGDWESSAIAHVAKKTASHATSSMAYRTSYIRREAMPMATFPATKGKRKKSW